MGHGGEESVKVAVRCRPFNQREKAMGAKLCIDMNGPTTTIKDLSGKHDDKPFTFDYSYWSHDGFHEDENGIQVADTDKYSSQQDVFDSLGVLVLNNAFEGFNTSLFAYGQTGSGKSYSMVGYPPNVGIVPMAFDRLFKTIKENDDPNTTFEVTFSMLEVYMEAVADLIAHPSTRKKGGLKVRQNPKLGRFYVEGLTKTAVTSYEQIDALTEKGTSHRTVAATKMNATSSRAHTVVTVLLTIKTVKDGQKMTKTSEINLVDLAGSERAGSTGATGDTLKEGAKINQSLSALGNVISALADGKKAPFRDSKLTMLLQNALGGNSKTIMIAAVSPADVNYEESLSTLRYADRAKQIKTKAAVNESPTDKLIRELREANELMKKQLEQAMQGLPPTLDRGDGASSEDQQLAAKRAQHAMELQLKLQEEELRQLDGSAYQEQVTAHKQVEEAERRARDEKEAKLASMPHLANMNEDPHLNGMMIYFLPTGENSIGAVDKDAHRKKRMEKQKKLHQALMVTDAFHHPGQSEKVTTDGEGSAVDEKAPVTEGVEETPPERGAPTDSNDHPDPVPEHDGNDHSSEQNPYIELTGLGVILKHAVIVIAEDLTASLIPHPDIAANDPENMLVNGVPTRGTVTLNHHDRIKFGKNHLYLFINPKSPKVSEGTPAGKIPFELAMEEIMANKPPVTHAYGLSSDVSALMDRLIPLVEQANEYTKELGKARQWHIKYMNPLYAGLDEGDPTVLVQMVNEDTGNEWYLSPGQFEDRLFAMEQAYRDMDHNYDTDQEDDDDDLFEEGQEDLYFDEKAKTMKARPKTSRPRATAAPPKETDPFTHATADVVIGTVKIPLDGIAYNQTDDDDFFIKDHSEKSQGTLEVKIQPCDKDRNPITEFRENPDELQGQALYFELVIRKAHLKVVKRARGVKIVYSHANLGGYKVWCEGQALVDNEGYDVPGAIQFSSSELLSVPTVGRNELTWLLGGAELTAVVLTTQSDDPEFLKKQNEAQGSMAEGMAKITSLLSEYQAQPGNAVQVLDQVLQVLNKKTSESHAQSSPPKDSTNTPPTIAATPETSSDVELLKKELEIANAEKEKLTIQLQTAREQQSNAHDLETLQKELDTTKLEKDKIAEELALAKTKVDSSSDASTTELTQAKSECAATRKECESKDAEINVLKAQLVAKEAEIEVLHEKYKASGTKLAEVSEAHQRTSVNATKLKGELTSKEAELSAVKSELDDMKRKPTPKSGVCTIM